MSHVLFCGFYEYNAEITVKLNFRMIREVQSKYEDMKIVDFLSLSCR